jgi:hypothetical protein
LGSKTSGVKIRFNEKSGKLVHPSNKSCKLRFAIGKAARRNPGEILLSYLLILRYIDIEREGRYEIMKTNNIIVYQQCNVTTP